MGSERRHSGNRRGATLAAVSLCALICASAAGAHLSVDPSRVQAGADVDLTFSAPNEDDPLGIDHVTVSFPVGFALDDGEAKAGWTQSRTEGSITWANGMIPKGEYATFSLRGTAPAKTGPVTFGVAVGDRSGKSLTYHATVDVVASGTRDNGARSLGKAALGAAILAALLALGALFIGLYLWLRPPPP